MNWRAYWDEKAKKNNPLEQVGRNDDTQALANTQAHLLQLIDPQPDQNMLDLCCGNGLMSRFFAPKVKAVVGLDLSPALIAEAKKQSEGLSNLEFFQQILIQRPWPVQEKFDFALLHFSFQYFTTIGQGHRLLEGILDHVKPGGVLYLTDIPNHYHAHKLYTGWIGRLKYFKHRWLIQGEMGSFWKPDILQGLAEQMGFEVEVLEQPAHLPYAHYRFDAVLRLPAKT